MSDRLSTCYHCRGTVRRVHFSNWEHVVPPKVQHAAEPDDGAVSEPADDEAGDDYFGDERGSTATIER